MHLGPLCACKHFPIGLLVDANELLGCNDEGVKLTDWQEGDNMRAS
jgi:hypothetical protein